MRLEYQISTVGQSQLKRVMRSIEQESASSAKRALLRDTATAKKKVSVAESAGAASVRTAEKEAAQKQRLAEQTANKRVREEKKAIDQVRRYEQRQMASRSAWLNRQADRQRRDEERSHRNALVARQRVAERMSRGVIGGVRGGLGAVAGGIRSGAGLVGLTATAAAGNAVRVRAGLDSNLRDVANAGYKPGGRSRKELYGQSLGLVDQISGKTGTQPEDLSAAMAAVMEKTGDFDSAAGSLAELDEIAIATKSALDELGTAFGSTFDALKRSGSTDAEAHAGALDMTRLYAGHGKEGSMELRDSASQSGKIVGAASQIGGDRVQAQGELSALLQEAAKYSSGPEDAGTAVKNLVPDLIKNSKKLGVNAMNAEGTQLRSMSDVLPEILEKSGGKLENINKVFGQQSRAAVLGLLEQYNQAGGGDAGKSAVGDVFAKYAGQVMSKEQVKESSGFAIDGPARQFGIAMNKFNTEVGGELLPQLTRLTGVITENAEALGDLAEKAVDAAEWLAENPFTGMGIVVGGFMLKELAVVGMGALVNQALAKMLGVFAARAAGGAALDVLTDLPGGKAGKGKLIGRLAPKLGVLGGVAGAASLPVTGATLATFFNAAGVATSIENDEEQRQNLAAHRNRYANNPTLARYAAGSEAFNGDNSVRANAQLDPSLQGSAAAIQAALAPGAGQNNDGAAQQIEAAGEQRKAASEMREAARALNNAADGMRDNPARHSPILER